MAAVTTVTVDEPQLVIDTWGEGALLRWEHSGNAGISWTEGGQELIDPDVHEYVIEYRAGDDDTLFRHRYSSSNPVTADDFGGYSDVRPVTTPSLVATPGDSAANSYLTLDQADVLAAEDLGPASVSWLVASRNDRRAALKRATREIDAHLRTSGPARYSSTQSLLYPRAVDVTAGVATIPRWITGATYAQAKHLLRNAAVLDAAQTRKARAMDSASEPNTSYAADMRASPTNLCDEAMGYLAGGKAGAATITSVRIGTDYSYPVTGTDTSELLP
jgi:hypothetical protein